MHVLRDCVEKKHSCVKVEEKSVSFMNYQLHNQTISTSFTTVFLKGESNLYLMLGWFFASHSALVAFSLVPQVEITHYYSYSFTEVKG